MCGRTSVQMAEKDALATCGVCQNLAVSGKLEKERFRKNLLSPGRNAHKKGMPKFTERQRAFAAHPEVTMNPRKAAEEVGYSKYYAKSHSLALREQLAPLIMQYQEEAKRRSAISIAKVQQELASMGFANIIDYFDVRDDGSMLPKKINDLTREQTAAIQEMKMVEYENPESGEREYRIGYIKLADKRANLVELGKSLGMFSQRGGDDGDDDRRDMLKQVPTEDLEKAERLLMDAVKKSRDQRSRNNAVEGECKEVPATGVVKMEGVNE